MITIKGFFSNPTFINNNDKTTAIFGELTQYSSSFARDYKTYTKNSKVLFNVFSSKDGLTNITLGDEFTLLGCEVGEWCYETGPNISSTSTKTDFISLLQSHFGARVRNVNCGDLTTDGTNRLPVWVSWETVGQSGTYFYKVWLANQAFESSYDEFEILVIPPVERVDSLFQPFPDLLVELSKNNIAVIHERMQNVRGKFPETLIETEMIEVFDRVTTGNKVAVGWTVLIYGPYGNTSDHIKDAIKAYISVNSTNTENDWRVLMPDLFNTTCFYIVPRWDKFAIQPRLALPGIHSPVITALENIEYVKEKTNTYISQAHLNTNLQTTLHPYKRITLNIVGGEFNRLSFFKFTDYFSDYLGLESTTEDYNRQEQSTKDITTLLTQILKKIDSFNEDPSLPTNLRLIEKYNQRFIVGKYENIEYYVLMKPTQQP